MWCGRASEGAHVGTGKVARGRVGVGRVAMGAWRCGQGGGGSAMRARAWVRPTAAPLRPRAVATNWMEI